MKVAGIRNHNAFFTLVNCRVPNKFRSGEKHHSLLKNVFAMCHIFVQPQFRLNFSQTTQPEAAIFGKMKIFELNKRVYVFLLTILQFSAIVKNYNFWYADAEVNIGHMFDQIRDVNTCLPFSYNKNEIEILSVHLKYFPFLLIDSMYLDVNLYCEGIYEAEQNILPQTSLDLFLCHALVMPRK